MNLFFLVKDFFVTIYQYREYFKQAIARDLRKKYKRSALGYLWSMLQPLFMMIILSIVFSHILKSGVQNYSVFLFCAMITWSFFDATCNGCFGVIHSNARIIDQMPVPKYIFPVSVAFYNLVNFFLTLVPLLGVMLVTGQPITSKILLLPVILLPLFCFTLGVSLFLCVAYVFFDDTQHLTNVLFKALYFLCPILYSREHLPPWLVKWVTLNPLFTIIENMRSIIYYGNFPEWYSFGYSCVTALIALVFGLWIFKKTSEKFIYFI